MYFVYKNTIFYSKKLPYRQKNRFAWEKIGMFQILTQFGEESQPNSSVSAFF